MNAFRISGILLSVMMFFTSAGFSFAEMKDDADNSSIKIVELAVETKDVPDEVVSYITEFMDTLYDIRFNGKTYSSDVLSMFDCSKKANNNHIDFLFRKAEYQNAVMQKTDVQIDEVDLNREYKEVAEDGETYTVSFYDLLTYTDAWYPLIEQTTGIVYTVSFEKVDGTLLLLDFMSSDDFDLLFRDTDFDMMSLVDKIDVYDKKVSDMQICIGSDEVLAVSSTSTYPSVTKITSYAVNYAYSYNSLFASYQSTNNDCQNFASQCIWYGLGGSLNSTSINNHAAPMIASGSNSRMWYHDAYNHYDPNANWIAVESFDNCIGSASSTALGLCGTVTSGCANAVVGDVIQLDWNGDGWYDHSMVVVAVSGNSGSRNMSNLTAAGHTSNTSGSVVGNLGALGIRTIHISKANVAASGSNPQN